jgi:hypothetical protein
MVFLVGEAGSYERGTPVPGQHCGQPDRYPAPCTLILHPAPCILHPADLGSMAGSQIGTILARIVHHHLAPTTIQDISGPLQGVNIRIL